MKLKIRNKLMIIKENKLQIYRKKMKNYIYQKIRK